MLKLVWHYTHLPGAFRSALKEHQLIIYIHFVPSVCLDVTIGHADICLHCLSCLYSDFVIDFFKILSAATRKSTSKDT